MFLKGWWWWWWVAGVGGWILLEAGVSEATGRRRWLQSSPFPLLVEENLHALLLPAPSQVALLPLLMVPVLLCMLPGLPCCCRCCAILAPERPATAAAAAVADLICDP